MSVDIVEVTDLDRAFGTTKDLPKMEEIPEDFFEHSNKWVKFFEHVFYRGFRGVSVTPKEGVDMVKVGRWLDAHAQSWEPKHEHKTAGVAFRMSQWLDDWKFEPAPTNSEPKTEKETLCCPECENDCNNCQCPKT